MKVLEDIICSCVASGTTGRPRIGCSLCRESGRRPMVGTGHLWADGKWRDEAPPSTENFVIRTYEFDGVGVKETGSTPAPVPKRPDVPADFAWTDRAVLRRTALDFAIRAGSLMGARIRSGAEVLAEAEEIERWIADVRRKDDVSPA